MVINETRKRTNKNMEYLLQSASVILPLFHNVKLNLFSGTRCISYVINISNYATVKIIKSSYFKNTCSDESNKIQYDNDFFLYKKSQNTIKFCLL